MSPSYSTADWPAVTDNCGCSNTAEKEPSFSTVTCALAGTCKLRILISHANFSAGGSPATQLTPSACNILE